MTNEDKKIAAKYMGWNYGQTVFHVTMTDTYIEPDIAFDLNDAALCVAEMQKRGDWEQFHDFVIEWGDLLSKASFAYITAWLMTIEDRQAKNFFKAFVEWRHSSVRALRRYRSPEEIKQAAMSATNKAFERYMGQANDDDILSIYRQSAEVIPLRDTDTALILQKKT